MTPINAGNNLSKAKNQRVNGVMSREEYWTLVSSALNAAQEIGSLLGAGMEVHIRKSGLFLDITIPNNSQLITLQIDPKDIRTVPSTYIAEGTYEPLLSHVLLSLASE